MYTSGTCEQNAGYLVSYADLQEMHALEAKIRRAKAAVQSCLDIGTGCLNHTCAHTALVSRNSDDEMGLALLEVYQTEMQHRLNSLNELETQTKSTLGLVSFFFPSSLVNSLFLALGKKRRKLKNIACKYPHLAKLRNDTFLEQCI